MVLQFGLDTKSREIIKSCISFVKVIIVVSMDELVADSQNPVNRGEGSTTSVLDKILLACCKWSSEHKSHFKVPCRFIIERLVRKLGNDCIAKRFPREHAKLLSSIRKQAERAKQAKKDCKKGSADAEK